MTTTAADQFTSVTQFGTGASWIDLSNLADGSSGEAYAEYGVFGGAKGINFSIPGFMAALDNGSNFDSLKVTLQFKMSSIGGAIPTAYLNEEGADRNSLSVNTGLSYSSTTLEGDASYWGLTGTPSEIFANLKDGDIDFILNPGHNSGTVYVRNVYATLTYTLPDTKRASLQMRCL